MIKKILIGIVIVIFVIVGLFASIGGWAYYKSSSYEKTAVPFIEKVIPELSMWDIYTFREYLSQEFIDETSDEDLNKIIGFMSKMGDFYSMDAPKFVHVNTTMGNESVTLITYSVSGYYENGDANITIILREIVGGFEVYKFHIDSPALMK
jgi:hypothetical protein